MKSITLPGTLVAILGGFALVSHATHSHFSAPRRTGVARRYRIARHRGETKGVNGFVTNQQEMVSID
jgi:hypothetical protein